MLHIPHALSERGMAIAYATKVIRPQAPEQPHTNATFHTVVPTPKIFHLGEYFLKEFGEIDFQ